MSNDVHDCCTPKVVETAASPANLASPRVREALVAIQNAGALVNWRGLTSEEDQVRVTLLRMYAERGRAPSIAALARQLEVNASELEPLLAKKDSKPAARCLGIV